MIASRRKKCNINMDSEEETEKMIQPNYSQSPSSFESNSSYSNQNFNLFLKQFMMMHTFGLSSIILVLIWIYLHLGGLGWSQPSLKFNFHPFLMIVAMVYLYGNAILTFRMLKNTFTKYKLKLIHGMINLVILILSWISFYCVINFHNQLNIKNFYSLHSWLGIFTLIAFNIQAFSGFISFLYPGLSPKLRKSLLPFHVFSGIVIFLSSAVCCFTGITEKAFFSLPSKINNEPNPNAYSNLSNAGLVINFLGFFIFMFTITTGWLVTHNYAQRNGEDVN